MTKKYKKYFPSQSDTDKAVTPKASSSFSINFTPEYGQVFEAFCSNSDITKRRLGEKMLELYLAIFGTHNLNQVLSDQEKREKVMVNILYNISKEASLHYEGEQGAFLRMAIESFCHAFKSEVKGEPALDILFDLADKTGLPPEKILGGLLEYLEKNPKQLQAYVEFMEGKKNGK